MDFSNKGGSVYHRLLAIYLRTPNGEILRSIGAQAEQFNTFWSSIKDKVIEASEKDPAENILSGFQVSSNDSDKTETIHLVERPVPSSPHIAGVAINSEEGSSSITEFEKFFSKLLINQSCIDAKPSNPSDEAEALAQKLTDLFDKHLRFEGRDDKWVEEGRTFFVERVRYYVSRNIKLEACLPAFPCKSSNKEKVTGEDPDKGEELALRRLHDFVKEVEQIYEPGAELWIISDGHVFSDCIGVDDTTVDAYSKRLHEMNHTICEELGSHDRVCFRSLVDIFDLRSHVDNLSQVIHDLHIPEIDHHIDTDHTDDAEVSRRILMAGCAPDPAALRERIDSGEKSIIALYRGFSRFMFEDLDLHPATKGLSKKKKKKLASLVSFEMIQRNQSYSNLVEMMFPDHLRLSIHAHNNAGPKFGIQLFDTEVVRATENLEPDALKASSDDLLHIPTPWHNCVVQIVGDDTLHVVKSKVVEEALDTQNYDGGFVEGDASDGRGGFFALKDLSGKIVDKPVDGPIVGAEEVVAEAATSGSPESSAIESVQDSDASSAQDSSDTDATSIDEEPESKENTNELASQVTEGPESAKDKDEATKNTDKILVAKLEVKSKVGHGDKQGCSVEADDILNLPYLRLLGVDPSTLQELKETVSQWAASNVNLPPVSMPVR